MKTTMPHQLLQVFTCLMVVLAASGTAKAAGPSTSETSQTPAAAPAPPLDSAITNLTSTQNWNGPEKVLPQVHYDGLPITEVGEDLRTRFGNAFDVLFPNQQSGGGNSWDWMLTSVSLRLQDVTASEIFNAMNMVFETSRTPLRWELVMNGHRPTAVLRDLAEPNPEGIDPKTGLPNPASSQPDEKPMVFFVGDLVGSPTSGGMSLEQVVETVSEACRDAKIQPSAIASHKQAQLLIIRGTDQDIKFVQTTLSALRDKVRMDAQRQSQANRAEPGKTSETKSP